MSRARLAASERAALREHLARVAAEARRLGEPRLAAFRLSVPACDPLDLFAAAAGGERFFFEAPARGVALAAAGAVARVESEGPARFAEAGAAARALLGTLRVAGARGDRADADTRAEVAPDAGRLAAEAESARPPLPPEAGPLLVGGFAFDDATPRGAFASFPALAFALPAVALTRRHGRAWCTLAARVAPGAEPEAVARSLEARAAALLAPRPRAATGERAPRFGLAADRSPEAFRGGVRRALAEIAAGELEKVVLARACTLTSPDGFDAARVLAALRRAQPRCTAYAVGRGDACFVGATPECLLRLEDSRLETGALAGSAPRGRTPREDAAFAAALRESKKEQAEHAVVRRAIEAALAPCCEAVEAPEAPGLLRLEGIQHLATPIRARLARRGPEDLFALLARLHPTPAVSGAPREAARAFLAAHEGLARGWYAGGIGWMSPRGDGEIAVALRGALLRGRRATLAAGAGIVEGSDPDAELAETTLKLRAVLGALVEL